MRGEKGAGSGLAAASRRLWRGAGKAAGALILLLMAGALPAFGQTSPKLPRFDGRTHLGVAACAGPCHARQSALGIAEGPAMRGSEIAVWQDADTLRGAHSRAHASLTSPLGRAIADNLGLRNAATAGECLSCHSDAAVRRGERFQVSDGVSCESCHGGAEKWIATHYAPGATHADNIARGLFPTTDPVQRARLCASCHLGATAQDQFANHAMMAAGHPRLVFESELFTELQAHHYVDDDYRRRKPQPTRAEVWALGQAVALRVSLDVFEAQEKDRIGIGPEPALFDCRSCHRAFDDLPDKAPIIRANPMRGSGPGALVWNDSHLPGLRAAALAFAPGEAETLEEAARAFQLSLGKSAPSREKALRQFSAAVDAVINRLSRARYDRAATEAAVRLVLDDTTASRLTAYAAAEQAVMAIDSLTRALADAGGITPARLAAARPDMDAAYALTRDANAYDPEAFAAVMRRLRARLGL
jgi:hypothetical protein